MHFVQGALSFETLSGKNTTDTINSFNSLVGVLNRMGIYWSRAVGIAANSAPSMMAKKAGVATKVR